MANDEKVVGSVTLKEGRELRLRLNEYKGKKYWDARIFEKIDGGDFVPTRKGVTFHQDMLSEVLEMFKAAGGQ